MRRFLLAFLLLLTTSPAWGAEFLISRSGGCVNPTPEIDMMCYKPGDIIDVRPDGYYTDKPWLTVLAVPGLSEVKVLKLMEGRRELVDVVVSLTEAEFQIAKDLVQDIVVNDKTYKIYMGQYVNPQLISNIDGVRTYNVKKLADYERRRFKIPASIMATLFPAGTYRKSISKTVFLNNVRRILDKTFNLDIEDTTWGALFLAEVGQ